jgi:threonyl-tRNA synthetase
MVHRAPFGSLERFCGLLIEHFGGNFPTWLAPEQVRILTVSDHFSKEASHLVEQLKLKGIRTHQDDHLDSLGAKIRRAETEKVPHMFILGAKEIEQSSVSIRSRIHKSIEGMFKQEEAIDKILELIQNRSLPDNF